MAKWLAAIIVAFVLGTATAYAWFTFGPGAIAEGPPSERADLRSERAGLRSEPATAAPPPAHTTLAEITALTSDFEQTAALYALLRDARRPTVERLLAEAEDLRPRRERLAAKSILYARYAELDPLAAVDHALKQGTDAEEMVRRIFMAWAKHDLEAALAHANTLQGRLRQGAASGVLAVSEDLDPARRQAVAAMFSLEDTLAFMDTMEQFDGDPAIAWQQALGTESQQVRAQQLLQIGPRWVEQDPEQALAAALELPPGGMLGGVAPFLLEHWVAKDVDAALDWLLAQPQSPMRARLLGVVASAVADTQPQDALALAQTLEGSDRHEVIQAALQAWARKDAPAAMEALQGLADVGLSQEARYSILAQWSQVDPNAAFEWALAQKKTSFENMHLVAMPLQQIARGDPQQALRLAEKLSGLQKQTALASVLGVWAHDDPRAAAEWLETATGDMTQAVSAVAFAFGQSAPAEAFEWAKGLPKESQELALMSLVSAATMSSPDAAADYVSKISDPRLQAEATETLVMGWAQHDPQEAARWVTRNTDAQQRPALYQQLFRSWGFVDRDGAQAELRRLSGQDERDSAALGLVAATAFGDAEFAERIYDGIRGDDAKRDAAQALYRGLLHIDPERAERFRKEAGIEEDAAGPSYRVGRVFRPAL